DAVIAGLGIIMEPLGSADRPGGQLLVHDGLEVDMIVLEMPGGSPESIVIDPDRRTAITGDEAGSIEACSNVARALHQRQLYQRLVGRNVDPAPILGELVVQFDCSLDHLMTSLRLPAGRRPAEADNVHASAVAGCCAGSSSERALPPHIF